jgi:hypothetical protein
MKPNERSIEQWDTWGENMKGRWLIKYVWGDDTGTFGVTDGALDSDSKLTTHIGYTCKLCTLRWGHSDGKTIVDVEKHIETPKHKQNYWLSKLAGGN